MEKLPKRRKLKKRDGWKSDEVWTLISTLFNYPELWNENTAEYHDPEKRRKCLMETCKILNKDQKDVLMKWQNLRNRYMAELEKLQEKNIDSTRRNSETKWEYFQALNFLNKSLPEEAVSNQDTKSVYVLEAVNTDNSENIKQRQKQSYEDLHRESILNRAINTLGCQTDEIKLFTDYVASELRKMHPENQEKVKNNILRDILLTKTNNYTPSAMTVSKQF